MWVLFYIETVVWYKLPLSEYFFTTFTRWFFHYFLSELSVRYLSTSIAAIHPNPAAVIACL